MRLDKYLADAGYGTRQNVKKIIKNGSVAVNGRAVKDAGFHMPEDAAVTVDGALVEYRTHHYYMLHKPAGFLTANSDASAPTVLDLFPENLRHKIFAVGRLDKDTVGLLLLTDDGELGHRLTSPKYETKKVYELRTNLPMTFEDVQSLSAGVTLRDGTAFRPAELVLNAEDPTFGRITLTEGKYHEVKRLLKYCGKEVTFLKRISMGSLVLDDSLKEGEYRDLFPEEIELLVSDPLIA